MVDQCIIDQRALHIAIIPVKQPKLRVSREHRYSISLERYELAEANSKIDLLKNLLA